MFIEGGYVLNPLSANTRIQNSHLLSLYVSYKSSSEKLLKYQIIVSCVIMSLILITICFIERWYNKEKFHAEHSLG